MKKMLMFVACACAMLFTGFADDAEVTVKVSVAGSVNSAKLRNECAVAGQKAAVKKYLDKMGNSQITEKVVADAMASYAKFIGEIEVDEQEFEDGELTTSYTVTIKQTDIAEWLGTQGVSSQTASDAGKIKIVVMEEPPDAGQMVLGEDMGKFFFTRYAMFQRKVRDVLIKGVGQYNFDVVLLEDTEKYEPFKKHDPVLVGVNYSVDHKCFEVTKGEDDDGKMTRAFTRVVQEDNPDTIALYYRIDTLAFDPNTGRIRTSIALSFKNFANNVTTSIGTRDFQMSTSNTQQDMIMADFGTCVERAMTSLLNGEGMGAKLQHIVTKMNNEAARPKGPMRLVVNCSKVDKKIKTRFRVNLKKALIAKSLTAETKIVKDSLSCGIPRKEGVGDLDELWVAVQEILQELLGDDTEVSDDWAAKDGDTLTVTVGK